MDIYLFGGSILYLTFDGSWLFGCVSWTWGSDEGDTYRGVETFSLLLSPRTDST
jgi:hypothetical protein